MPTKEDYAAAAAQMGVNTATGESDKQVPENLSQAADVVTNESELDALRAQSNLDQASFDDLKRQAIAAAKAEKAQEVEEKKKQPVKKPTPVVKQIKPPKDDIAEAAAADPEFAAKAAVVAKAEAANSIVDSSKTLTKVDTSTTDAASAAAEVAAYEAQEKQKEQEKKIQEKYAADKQAALDQGYSEEQAEQYAQQEAYAAADNVGATNPNVAPANGVNNVPPVTLGNPPNSATRVQLGDMTSEDSIDVQLKQA